MLDKKRNHLNGLIRDAAREHGKQDDPDHECGDLQDALSAAIDLLSEKQLDQLAQAVDGDSLHFELEEWQEFEAGVAPATEDVHQQG